jgi:hypothetical protein
MNYYESTTNHQQFTMNQPFLPAENSPCSQPSAHWDPWEPPHQAYIAVSCVIGLAISYTSIWAQSLISATSFLAPWSGYVRIAMKTWGKWRSSRFCWENLGFGDEF